jgi:hypothetical protein
MFLVAFIIHGPSFGDPELPSCVVTVTTGSFDDAKYAASLHMPELSTAAPVRRSMVSRAVSGEYCAPLPIGMFQIDVGE